MYSYVLKGYSMTWSPRPLQALAIKYRTTGSWSTNSNPLACLGLTLLVCISPFHPLQKLWSAEDPFHLSVHKATATVFRRHIYPDIWRTQQTTEEALLEGRVPHTTRILGLWKVGPCQILCSGLKGTQNKRKAQPNSPHNFTFHKSFVVWVPVSIWDRNGTVGTPP